MSSSRGTSRRAGRRPAVTYTPSAFFANLSFRLERTVDLLEINNCDELGETLWSRQYLAAARWESILQPRKQMHPRLVRGFYENMELPLPGATTFVTTVDGFNMVITPEVISNALHLSIIAPLPLPVDPVAEDQPQPAAPFQFQPITNPDITNMEIVMEMTGAAGNTYVRGRQFPEDFWFLGHILHQQIWNHGNMQQYSQSFLRLCYHASRGCYVDLGPVIFDTLVACKKNTTRPSSDKVQDLWLGHLVTRLMISLGFPAERRELEADFLIPFTWDSWRAVRQERQKAIRGLQHPAGGGGGDEEMPDAPPAQARRRRHLVADTASFVPADQFRDITTHLSRRMEYGIALQEQVGRYILGEEDYTSAVGAAKTEAQKRHEEFLRQFYPDPSHPSSSQQHDPEF